MRNGEDNVQRQARVDRLLDNHRKSTGGVPSTLHQNFMIIISVNVTSIECIRNRQFDMNDRRQESRVLVP